VEKSRGKKVKVELGDGKGGGWGKVECDGSERGGKEDKYTFSPFLKKLGKKKFFFLPFPSPGRSLPTLSSSTRRLELKERGRTEEGGKLIRLPLQFSRTVVYY